MSKFSAPEIYRRMAELLAESGMHDEKKITSSISKAAKVSFESVSKWKDGRTKSVTMPPISRFCDVYGANPDYISTGTLPKYRTETFSPELEVVLKQFPKASEERKKIILDLLRSDIDEDT